MEQCSRAGKRVVLACYARRSDVIGSADYDGVPLLPEVDFVLDDACDQQRRAAQVGLGECREERAKKMSKKTALLHSVDLSVWLLFAQPQPLKIRVFAASHRTPQDHS